MEARMFCPTHGKLEFEDVVIKNGMPVCRKCMSVLEFGKVRPRPVVSVKVKKTRKSRLRKEKKEK